MNREEYMAEMMRKRDAALNLSRWEKFKAKLAGRIAEWQYMCECKRALTKSTCKCKHCGCGK